MPQSNAANPLPQPSTPEIQPAVNQIQFPAQPSTLPVQLPATAPTSAPASLSQQNPAANQSNSAVNQSNSARPSNSQTQSSTQSQPPSQPVIQPQTQPARAAAPAPWARFVDTRSAPSIADIQRQDAESLRIQSEQESERQSQLQQLQSDESIQGAPSAWGSTTVKVGSSLADIQREQKTQLAILAAAKADSNAPRWDGAPVLGWKPLPKAGDGAEALSVPNQLEVQQVPQVPSQPVAGAWASQSKSLPQRLQSQSQPQAPPVKSVKSVWSTTPTLVAPASSTNALQAIQNEEREREERRRVAAAAQAIATPSVGGVWGVQPSLVANAPRLAPSGSGNALLPTSTSTAHVIKAVSSSSDIAADEANDSLFFDYAAPAPREAPGLAAQVNISPAKLQKSITAQGQSTVVVPRAGASQAQPPQVASASSVLNSSSPANNAASIIENANAFGGPRMTKDFEKWCQTQLLSITGSNDTTLVQFLMTIESASEIKAYINECLGKKASKSVLDDFATGFLQFKDFDKTSQVVKKGAAPVVVAPQEVKAGGKKPRGKKG